MMATHLMAPQRGEHTDLSGMMYEGRGWIGEEELPAAWSLPAKCRESDGPYAGAEQCARENDSHESESVGQAPLRRMQDCQAQGRGIRDL